MTVRSWSTERILVTVKSYPRPSSTRGETVCVAGTTSDGEWIRLYPVTFRDLPPEQRFDKYDWIECRIAKSPSDHRDESYIVDESTIRKVGHLGTERDWEERRRLLIPKVDFSLEALKASSRSLGLIKPANVLDFYLEKDAPEWSPEKKVHLAQTNIFTQRVGILEKVPWVFRYRFRCNDPECEGHNLSMVDWEVFQSYRSWKRQYPRDYTARLREKYYDDLALNKDLYFFVGTPLAQDRYRTFMVIGIFYPPKDSRSIQARLDL